MNPLELQVLAIVSGVPANSQGISSPDLVLRRPPAVALPPQILPQRAPQNVRI
jgi:hypothetical protein